MIPKDIKEKSRLTKEEWREFTKSVWNIPDKRSNEHPAVFSNEIPYRLIKMFSFANEVILDPFVGTGITLEEARKLERNSIGIEINEQYIQIAKRKLNQTILHGESFFQIMRADSREIPLKDEYIDLIVTSPPYWNKIKYDDDEKNLCNFDNYLNFIRQMKEVFVECYRVLRKGRRMCIITANVHEKGKNGLIRYPLASDYIIECRNTGFELVSEIIWSKLDTGSPYGASGGKRPIFGSYPYPPNFLFFNLHEYILIFRKPTHR